MIALDKDDRKRKRAAKGVKDAFPDDLKVGRLTRAEDGAKT